MIVGIGREPRFERGRVDGRRGDATSSAARARAISGFFACSSGSPSRIARASSVSPGGDQRAGQAADHLGIVGRHLADLAEDIGGARGVALAQHLLAHRDQRLDLGLAAPRLGLDLQLREQLVERLLDLPLAAIIGEIGDRLALVDRIDRRDRLDPELRREQLFLVDVDLGEPDALVGIIGGDLVEDRRRAACTARTIPPRNRG